MSWIKQLVFPQPRCCLICGRHHHVVKYVCQKCYAQIKRVYPPLCSNCGRPLLGAVYCCHCRGRKFFFDRVFSFGLYDGILKKLIHLFKFDKYAGLGDEITKIMINETDFVNAIKECTLVPVPLHPQRLLARGYNQAQVLCESWSKQTGQPWSEILIRISHGLPQAKYKLHERQHTVAGQFAIKRKWSTKLTNSRIALVDDVITTGSTLNECARILKHGGAAEVCVLTIATTLLK